MQKLRIMSNIVEKRQYIHSIIDCFLDSNGYANVPKTGKGCERGKISAGELIRMSNECEIVKDAFKKSQKYKHIDQHIIARDK
ncbi:hypothetical protein [Bacillus mesophilum]|uniref:Uncharacterized protein n=1 Tax=Bacillus mesophilum TaxID=1071718 RepID=A0A7V7RL10_9BACI|nr:hypothetical protein [Bacillus mesophilum]KAB2332412.1 hypothetical protein F7732_09915 [Bacillus mesophilum]